MTPMPPAGASMSASDGAASASMSQSQRPALQIIRDLLPFLWPRNRPELRARVVLALACMVVGRLVMVGVPLLYADAVDRLSGTDGVQTALIVPLVLLLAYGSSRFVGGIFQEGQDMLYARVSEAMKRSLSLRVFEHLTSLSKRFHLDRRAGGLQRIISRGVYFADALLRTVLFRILPSSLQFIFIAAILTASFGAAYAVATGVLVVVYLGVTFWITEWRKKLRREMVDLDTAAYALSMDALLNIDTLKYFNNERFEADRFDAALGKVEGATVRSNVSLSYLNLAQNFVFAVGLTGLMVLAAYDVVAGRLSVGEFVLVNSLLLQLSGPLSNYGFVYRTMREALIDSERLLDVLETAPEIEDRPDAKSLTVTRGAVRFEGIDFHYAPERKILFGVDFTIAPGQTVAVVGATGAGKSTLSNLLFRFYEPTSGRILIDDLDIREATQASLRGSIGMVPQDTVLFNDTIRSNIAYGDLSASQDAIEEAAVRARIHDFIAGLPEGYDTMVGERGLKLSGGEKQRVAIARTLLKNPPILVLDEATSALDTRTEREVQGALKALAADRTTLVIAHRLSTIMDADEILVMDGGRIIERGSHTDLLARPEGTYAAMWARQLTSEQGEAGFDPLVEETGALPVSFRRKS